MSVSLPQDRAILVDKDSRTSTNFYGWMTGVTRLVNAMPADASAPISAIATALGSPDGTVANIPDQTADQIEIRSGYGIEVSSGVPKFISLQEISDSGVGALLGITRDAYGRVTGTTDATITGTAGDIAVVNGNAVAGVPTLSLATVTDVGGGTLQRTTFDTKGRKTGTSAATTTDLPEGTNLYYTDERAQDAIGAALAAGTQEGLTITYDDAGNAISAANTDKGSAAVAAHVGAADPHPQYLTAAEGNAAYEPVFAKGGLIAGTNVTITGTLAGRLVGTGDITINASGGGGGANLPAVMARISLGF